MLACLCMPANAADTPPFTVTLSGPDTVVAGDKVILSVAMKNVSDHAIRIFFGERYTILIHDEDGKEPVHKGPGGGSSGYVPVEPGKIFTDREYLSAEYDLSKPGKYLVQLSRQEDDEDLKSRIVKSNEITITVAPRKQDRQP